MIIHFGFIQDTESFSASFFLQMKHFISVWGDKLVNSDSYAENL